MSFFQSIIANEIIIAACSSWLIAQIMKTLIFLIVNKEFRLERMVGDGGMPSCHSATVCALAVSTGLRVGFDSAIFAVAFILAIIVMHDAMGVRLETGKQAKIINDIIQEFMKIGVSLKSMSAEERLKEFVGHTGSQVFVGGLIGCCVAILEHFLFYI